MQNFNIFTQINKEITSYNQDRISIANVSSESDARSLSRKNKGGFDFSQKEMVNIIDLYYNSKFEKGLYDTENQRKLFLNICKFRADVASKQIDIDLKDFLFYPEEGNSEWGAYFLSKEFKDWAKENYFGEFINEQVELFPRYGTLVWKIVNGQPESVPLQTLRNPQDAKSLKDAMWVIIEHTDMNASEIMSMDNWDTEGLELGVNDTYTVYERYGYIPRGVYAQMKGEEYSGDKNELVDCLVITTLTNTDKKNKEAGHILFMEEIKNRPFVEVHWAKQHGRWLGIGEIENQIENQIGVNVAFNLFRRQLLWSSKKVFQSSDEGIAKNLIRNVNDGDVLQVGPNGEIKQVDMSNRAIGDFSKFVETLETNSDQKSFTYEVATGESMASGTPFRLGVLLSNSVNSHFALKREKLGLAFKRLVMDFIVKDFKKKNNKEHLVALFGDDKGFQTFKQMLINANLNEAVKASMLKGQVPDIEKLKLGVESFLSFSKTLFAKLPDGFYDTIKARVDLTVTGEEINLPKKLETLTNLYNVLAGKGDPKADMVLGKILALTGESPDMVGNTQSAQQQNIQQSLQTFGQQVNAETPATTQ